MSRSILVSISDLVEQGALAVSDGYRTKVSEHGRPGYRIVRVADVLDDDVRLTGPDFVSRDYRQQIGSKLGQAGDVLLTTKGTVGRVAIMPETVEPVVYSPQLCYFRVIDEEVIHPRYLRYWFSSSAFSGQAADRMNNTDMAAYINLADIRSLALDLPPISEQRAVAEVLEALDAKIAANAKLAALLGEHIAASFTSIVGPWHERVPLSELVSITKGVSYRSVDLVPSSTALVTLKSIQRDGNYSPRGLKAFAGAFKDVQKIRVGDLVVAQTDLTQAADVVGRAVRVPASSGFDTLVASLDLAIVRPIRGVETEFVLGVMRDRRFTEHCKSRTSGTTVLHLAKDAVHSFLAPKVPFEVQHRCAAAVRPAHHMRDAVARESEVLLATRDALLPQLMSGQIRVKDVEQMVGDVVSQ
jgi:type I restriction enzyme, S subunit